MEPLRGQTKNKIVNKKTSGISSPEKSFKKSELVMIGSPERMSEFKRKQLTEKWEFKTEKASLEVTRKLDVVDSVETKKQKELRFDFRVDNIESGGGE